MQDPQGFTAISPFDASASAAAASSLEPQRERPRRDVNECSFYKSLNTGEPKGSGLSFLRKSRKDSAKSKQQQSLSQDNFKKDTFRTIIRYLSYSGFQHPVTAKSLNSPTRTLLIDIWCHLFRLCFDDSVKITCDNVNDEVPKLFREIGYPFPISKSSMLAPGTSHQWPYHLAALGWLCELLIYENEYFPTIIDDPIDSTEPNNATLSGSNWLCNLLVANYPSYNHHKDYQKLSSSIYNQINSNWQDVEKRVQQQETKLAATAEEIKTIKDELEDNAGLGIAIESLSREKESLQTRLRELNINSQEMDTSIADLRGRRDQILSDQNDTQKQINTLEERIKAQGINRAEVERIRHEIGRLKDSITNRNKDATDLENDLDKITDEVAQTVERARCTTRSINKLLSNLSELTEECKLSSAAAWKSMPNFSLKENFDNIVDLNPKNATAEILGVDWPAMKQLLLQLAKQDMQQDETARKQGQRFSQEIEKYKKSMQQLNNAIKTLDKKTSLAVEDLQDLQAATQKDYSTAEEKIHKYESNLRQKKQQIMEKITLLEEVVNSKESELRKQSEVHRKTQQEKLLSLQQQHLHILNVQKSVKKEIIDITNNKMQRAADAEAFTNRLINTTVLYN